MSITYTAMFGVREEIVTPHAVANDLEIDSVG
jgi:hypothetical protein